MRAAHADIQGMDLEETPLLHFVDLALALLRVGREAPATMADAAALIERRRAQAHEDFAIDRAELLAHLAEARTHLAAAHALEILDARRFRTSPRGAVLLKVHPDGVDDGVLMDYPEFRVWVESIQPHRPPEDPGTREFMEGWSARQSSRTHEDNPYAADTAQHQAWSNGWLESDRHERE